MEFHTDLAEAISSDLSHNNVSYWSEDSGYHTSYTPGSLEISDENAELTLTQKKLRISHKIQVNFDISPEVNCSRSSKYEICKSLNVRNALCIETPVVRRGIKRHYEDSIDEGNHSAISTPTTIIAGEIGNLKVTDSNRVKENKYYVAATQSDYSDVTSNLYKLCDHSEMLYTSYPTTPVKKICIPSCKLSPSRRSNKKLNFTIHSLSCETHAVVKARPHSRVVRTIKFKPDQKVDMIKMLYQKQVIPPLTKILSYLSNTDICNLRSVSQMWHQVWEHVSKTRKQEFQRFLQNVKENQENCDANLTIPKPNVDNNGKILREVHNVLNSNISKSSPCSPPGTPRTNKFKKFTKAASLDSRLQLSCVRCYQPSKVTEEVSGEEWAECTSNSCSYQFCRFCKCDRHPGKSCIVFDIDGPSPSKRKKNSNAIATKKSKRNLRRLMM